MKGLDNFLAGGIDSDPDCAMCAEERGDDPEGISTLCQRHERMMRDDVREMERDDFDPEC